jgi:hypothetical protein
MKNFKQFLFENSQLISGLDTVMDDYDENIKEGTKFLRRLQEIYRETDDSILFRTGMDHDGYIVLLDKKTNYVNYFARFEYKKLDGDKYVTQVAVWRSYTPTLLPEEYGDIAKKVFFDILLKKFKKIASDQEQSKDGQRFWVNRMSDAVNKGLKVGLLKVGTKTINYYDKSKFRNIIEWIATLESSWGMDAKHRRYRFIIEE